MKTYRIENRQSGLTLGSYEGETRDEALTAMAKDAGYDSIEAMDEVTGGDARHDLAVIEGSEVLLCQRHADTDTELYLVSYSADGSTITGFAGPLDSDEIDTVRENRHGDIYDVLADWYAQHEAGLSGESLAWADAQEWESVDAEAYI